MMVIEVQGWGHILVCSSCDLYMNDLGLARRTELQGRIQFCHYSMLVLSLAPKISLGKPKIYAGVAEYILKVAPVKFAQNISECKIPAHKTMLCKS